MTRHARAIIAARNNADWYAMMFDIHGRRYRRTDSAFMAIDTPPPYHSWMTTLAPAQDSGLLALIDQLQARPGFGIKDSFSCLDLSSRGLSELFRASWIWARTVKPASTSGWVQVKSPASLRQWEEAWKSGGSPSSQTQFPPGILDRSDVTILGRFDGMGFDAGAVANVSSDSVGLSNWFGPDAFAAAATLCAALKPDLPVVGYVRDEGLAGAETCGFEATGSLRVWWSGPDKG